LEGAGEIVAAGLRQGDKKQQMTWDRNLEKYNDSDIVAHYAKMSGLQPCEVAIFGRWLKPGMAILDIGVGGGRTTPALTEIAGRYVGIDYSQAMVEACKKRFPSLEFRHCDARELSQFGDDEFDAVVFSFNGIDVITDDAGRARCLKEIARVLKPGGIYVFSSHNAKVVGVWPQLSTAKGIQIPWRIVRSIFKFFQMSARALGSKAFYAGEGYILDTADGGLDLYVSTPATMKPQILAVGLDVVEVVAGNWPETEFLYLTPWHYYACRKASAA